MAKCRKETDRGRVGYRLPLRFNGKRKNVWLGPITKRIADSVERHIDELIRCRRVNLRPEGETELWASTLTGSLRKALVEVGLVDAIQNRQVTEADKYLGPFLDRCIEQMVDATDRTKNNYQQAQKWLVEFLGADTLLIDVTPGDLDRWHRHLRASGLALSTRNKHVQRVRKFFTCAVDDRILTKSPAEKLKQERLPKGQRVDRSRQQFVDAALTAEVLRGLPSGDITLAFILARYVGMRRCEVFSLKWSDVDWELNRLRIDSPKTGVRWCPMFDAEAYLRTAFDAAPEGAKRVITHFNDVSSVTTLMRKQFVRVIGEDRMWPKTMQQLRSTRRTELQELFPGHVVNEWLGHDGETAELHYLQVTPEHWEKAGCGGVTGGVVPAFLPSSGAISSIEKVLHPASDTPGIPGIIDSLPPKGFEPLFLD